MREMIRHIAKRLQRGERKKLVQFMLLDLLISALDIFSLLCLLWVIRFYTVADGDMISSRLPAWLADRQSSAMILVFFAFFTVKSFLAFFVSRLQYRFSSSVALRLSGDSLHCYQHGSFLDFISTDSSVQVRRTGFQPFDFCQYFLAGLQQAATQFFLVVFTLIALFAYDPRLCLLLGIFLLPPVAGAFFLVRRQLTSAKTEVRASNESSFRYLLDAIKGWVEGNVWGRNAFFLQRFIRHRQIFSRALFRSLHIQTLPSRMVEVFAVLGLVVLTLLATGAGASGERTLFTLGAFMAAAYRIIPGLVKIVNAAGQMRAHLPELQQMLPEPLNKEGYLKAGSIHSIQLQQLSFGYDEKIIVRTGGVELKKGTLTGIKGYSGKGKTTLLHLILGLLEPATGSIAVNGKSRTSTELHSFWPSIAYLRQQPLLLHDTLRVNITLEEEDVDPERMGEALLLSGLDALLKTFPEGLEKMVMENGKNFSGGQQQRICFARALYRDADLYLLDEPFSELDEASTIQLMGVLQQLAAKGKIVVIVTHHSKSLRFCHQIFSPHEEVQAPGFAHAGIS